MTSMTFEVELDGTRRSVTVESVGAASPGGGEFRVRLDGQVHRVDVCATDLGLSLVLADGRSVDAVLTGLLGGHWFVQLPHADLSVVVDGRRQERGPSAAIVDGEQRVYAPMPGRVVRVLVKPGDAVALRQGLVVVEAMKMENELGSPKAGTVKAVAVTEGMSVEAGRLLVVVD